LLDYPDPGAREWSRYTSSISRYKMALLYFLRKLNNTVQENLLEAFTVYDKEG